MGHSRQPRSTEHGALTGLGFPHHAPPLPVANDLLTLYMIHRTLQPVSSARQLTPAPGPRPGTPGRAAPHTPGSRPGIGGCGSPTGVTIQPSPKPPAPKRPPTRLRYTKYPQQHPFYPSSTRRAGPLHPPTCLGSCFDSGLIAFHARSRVLATSRSSPAHSEPARLE